jgi:hypothetical protein
MLRDPASEILNWKRRRRDAAAHSVVADARPSARRLTVGDREVLVVRRSRAVPRIARA